MPSSQTDKYLWIAQQVFSEFPNKVSGLKFYTLDCGCIYYHRVFRDGQIDPTFGVYRDIGQGPCYVCTRPKEEWEDRIADESLVYNSGFQID